MCVIFKKILTGQKSLNHCQLPRLHEGFMSCAWVSWNVKCYLELTFNWYTSGPHSVRSGPLSIYSYTFREFFCHKREDVQKSWVTTEWEFKTLMPFNKSKSLRNFTHTLQTLTLIIWGKVMPRKESIQQPPTPILIPTYYMAAGQKTSLNLNFLISKIGLRALKIMDGKYLP